MADDGKGGTSDNGDGKDSSSTFTQADVDSAAAKARETALKEGEVRGYQHWQGEVDKAKAENTGLTGKLNDMEQRAIEKLPPDEQGAAMIKAVYAKLHESPASTDSNSQDGDDPPAKITRTQADGDDAKGQAQSVMAAAAKKAGLDPDKLDFSSTDAFMESIMKQKQGGEESDDADDDEDSGGPVDTSSHSTGGTTDITKMNPRDLIIKGSKTRVRRSVLGGRN